MVKKVIQQGRSHLGARSVLAVREHSQMARTPLVAFFNIPLLGYLAVGMGEGIKRTSNIPFCRQLIVEPSFAAKYPGWISSNRPFRA